MSPITPLNTDDFDVQFVYDFIFVAKNLAFIYGQCRSWLLRRNYMDSSRLVFISMQRRFHHIEKLRDILGDVTNEVSSFVCNGEGAADRSTELRDVKLSHGRRKIVKAMQIKGWMSNEI